MYRPHSLSTIQVSHTWTHDDVQCDARVIIIVFSTWTIFSSTFSRQSHPQRREPTLSSSRIDI